MKCPDCIDSGFVSNVIPVMPYVNNNETYYFDNQGDLTTTITPNILYICTQKHIWFAAKDTGLP